MLGNVYVYASDVFFLKLLVVVQDATSSRWGIICFGGAGVLGVGVTNPVDHHMLPLFGVCHQHYLRRRHMSSSLTPSVAILALAISTHEIS